MTHSSTKNNTLYAVEFFRLVLILSVIAHHITILCPEFRNYLAQILHSSGFALFHGVEFFFIIGGFFLYRKLESGNECASVIIKKTYFRLTPALLFAFIVCSIIDSAKWIHAPAVFSLLCGTALAPATIGYGDWFIGAYFWISCLYIGLFKKSKYGWLCLGIIMYFCMMLRLNAPLPDKKMWHDMRYYYSFIGVEFNRGLICMGWGMVAGMLADRIVLPSKWYLKLLFTIIEAFCLVNIYYFLADIKMCRLSYIEMQLLGVCLIVSVAHSWGYISIVLNKLCCIQYISRYTFSWLIGHMICINILQHGCRYDYGPALNVIFIAGGGLILGIIEYHLFECFLLKKLGVVARIKSAKTQFSLPSR